MSLLKKGKYHEYLLSVAQVLDKLEHCIMNFCRFSHLCVFFLKKNVLPSPINRRGGGHTAKECDPQCPHRAPFDGDWWPMTKGRGLSRRPKISSLMGHRLHKAQIVQSAQMLNNPLSKTFSSSKKTFSFLFFLLKKKPFSFLPRKNDLPFNSTTKKRKITIINNPPAGK